MHLLAWPWHKFRQLVLSSTNTVWQLSVKHVIWNFLGSVLSWDRLLEWFIDPSSRAMRNRARIPLSKAVSPLHSTFPLRIDELTYYTTPRKSDNHGANTTSTIFRESPHHPTRLEPYFNKNGAPNLYYALTIPSKSAKPCGSACSPGD